MAGSTVDMVQDLVIKSPLLVVGIGGPASRIAKQASAAIGCECLLVSNDKRDLCDYKSIFVNTGAWINPSGPKLRSFLGAKNDQVKSALEGYNTIIVVSNLAGKSGAAMAPLICNAARKETATTTVISFAIMPFGFENDRIFNAGVSLRRVNEASHATVVMDNDAFLDNNPELSKEECYPLVNSAIVEVASSIALRGVEPNMNILCTSRPQGDSEKSLRDSISMLYQEVADPAAIRRTVIYVMGGESLSLGALDQLVTYTRGIFKEEGTSEMTMATAAGGGGGGVRVHLVASAQQKTRFDSYDPLGIIPDQLDWDEPESASEIELAIPMLD